MKSLIREKAGGGRIQYEEGGALIGIEEHHEVGFAVSADVRQMLKKRAKEQGITYEKAEADYFEGITNFIFDLRAEVIEEPIA